MRATRKNRVQIATVTIGLFCGVVSQAGAEGVCSDGKTPVAEAVKKILADAQFVDDREIVGPSHRFSWIAKDLKFVSVQSEDGSKRISRGTAVRVQGLNKCVLSVRHVVNPKEQPANPTPSVMEGNGDWSVSKFSNPDIKGLRVNIEWDFKGKTPGRSVPGQVIAAGMPESGKTEIVVIRTEQLPTDMPVIQLGKSRNVKEVQAKELACFGYSADKWVNGPIVSMSTGRIVTPESVVAGKGGEKNFSSGSMTSCVGNGGASGGAVVSLNEKGEPELEGLQVWGRTPDGGQVASSCPEAKDELPGHESILRLDEKLSYRTGATIRSEIACEIAKLIATGACD